MSLPKAVQTSSKLEFYKISKNSPQKLDIVEIHVVQCKATMKILYPMPAKCPVCNNELHVLQMGCEQCGTNVEGSFKTCRFCRLDADYLQFLELFLRCRGNLKTMERELGVSYPTVRARLDSLLSVLELTPEPDRREENAEEIAARQRAVIERLERGEITAEEAMKHLRNVK